MCLYPIHIRNPAYESLIDCQHRSPFADISPTPIPYDYEVDVPCGRCWQCLRARRFEIVLRLKVELAVCKSASFFVTFTFDNVNLDRFKDDYLKPVRLWIDKMRKKYGKFRYYFLSELGEANRRLHFHGLVFGLPFLSYRQLTASWIYGRSWFGKVSARTCGYITKYVTKQQISPEFDYRPYLIYSKGIGSGPNGEGVDFVRSHMTHFDIHKATTPYCDALVFPGEISYSYSLTDYYLRKIYGEHYSVYRRYYRYLAGLRYSYQGRSFVSRDDWINSIRESRIDYPTAYRVRFERRIPLVPRNPRISSFDVFKYFIYNDSLKISY
ncbi:MAG: replication initiation protein [Microviridae sp.]|nr:MAG: replication initiation protein [Microviridae sp.]